MGPLFFHAQGFAHFCGLSLTSSVLGWFETSSESLGALGVSGVIRGRIYCMVVVGVLVFIGSRGFGALGAVSIRGVWIEAVLRVVGPSYHKVVVRSRGN